MVAPALGHLTGLTALELSSTRKASRGAPLALPRSLVAVTALRRLTLADFGDIPFDASAMRHLTAVHFSGAVCAMKPNFCL